MLSCSGSWRHTVQQVAISSALCAVLVSTRKYRFSGANAASPCRNGCIVRFHKACTDSFRSACLRQAAGPRPLRKGGCGITTDQSLERGTRLPVSRPHSPNALCFFGIFVLDLCSLAVRELWGRADSSNTPSQTLRLSNQQRLLDGYRSTTGVQRGCLLLRCVSVECSGERAQERLRRQNQGGVARGGRGGSIGQLEVPPSATSWTENS